SVAGVDAVHDVHGDDDLGRARADRDGALGLRVRRHGDVLHVELLRGRCWRRGLFQRVDAGDEGAGEPRVVVCLRAGVVDGRLARLAHVWSGIRDVEGDAADVGRAGGYALIEDGADLLDVTDGHLQDERNEIVVDALEVAAPVVLVDRRDVVGRG